MGDSGEDPSNTDAIPGKAGIDFKAYANKPLADDGKYEFVQLIDSL